MNFIGISMLGFVKTLFYPFSAGSTLDAESDVRRCQIVTCKVDSRAERVKYNIGIQAERAN